MQWRSIGFGGSRQGRHLPMRACGTLCIRYTTYRSEEDTPEAAMGNPERCLMGWRSQPQGRQAK